MQQVPSIRYVILFVRDMERSVAFYRDGLGLPLGMQSPAWTEFELDGTKLALHVSQALGPVPVANDHPGEKRGVAQEIVFVAGDPLAHRAELVRRGVNVAPPKVVHEAGPGQVGVSCIFEDPNGNTLSV